MNRDAPPTPDADVTAILGGDNGGAVGNQGLMFIDLKPKELLQRRYERLQAYGRFSDTKER